MEITAKFAKFGSGKIPDGMEDQLKTIGSYESRIDLAASAEDPISKWLTELIKRAKANLEAQRPHPIVNSELVKSIKPTGFDIADTTISIELQGKYYWKFVDQGVKGAKDSKRAPSSPYSYRDKKPPAKALADGIANKTIPVVPRVDRKTGRPRTIREQALVDARGLADLVWRRGIRATNFMSDALDESFVRQLTEQIADEIGRSISFTGPPAK
jgi:hypothetical protein